MKFIVIIFFTIFIYPNSYSIVENFNTTESIKVKRKFTKVKRAKTKKVKKVFYRKKSKKVVVKKVFKKRAIKKRVVQKKVVIKKATTNKKLVKTTHSNRAKLVIIMDDIAHKYELNRLKSLGLKVTPSIFPPSKMNMHSNLLAKDLKHFMVHLPLQSNSKALNKMHKTLLVTSSNKVIKDRVLEIKRLFPNVKFLNNHTGSVFSQNYKKSKALYSALLSSGILFLDSRTTKYTKFKKIAKEFNQRYYKCDHFIDNKVSTQAILKEIKRGIAIAKSKGYAVLIGHPHQQTFKALNLAKKYLKSVNLIYIDELW